MNATITRELLHSLPCRTRSISSEDPREQLCAHLFAILMQLLNDQPPGTVELDGVMAVHLVAELHQVAFDRDRVRGPLTGAQLREVLWSIQMETRIGLTVASSIYGAMREAVVVCERSVEDFILSGTLEVFMRMLRNWEESVSELTEVVESIVPLERRHRPGAEARPPARKSTAQPPRLGAARGPRPRGQKRRKGRASG
jgi:hypothetical protein